MLNHRYPSEDCGQLPIDQERRALRPCLREKTDLLEQSGLIPESSRKHELVSDVTADFGT